MTSILNHQDQEVFQVHSAEQKSAANLLPPHVDVLFLAFMAILTAMNDQQKVAQTQAKQLQANAAQQIKLNDQEEAINFYQLTENELYRISRQKRYTYNQNGGIDGGPPKKIPIYSNVKVPIPNAAFKVQTMNQQQEKIRDGLTNQMLMLRQNAQIAESQVNSTVDQSEQAAQEGSTLLQMLVTITNHIMRYR